MRLPQILEEPVSYQVNLYESMGPKRTGGHCSACCSMTPRSPLDDRGTLVGQMALSSVFFQEPPSLEGSSITQGYAPSPYPMHHVGVQRLSLLASRDTLKAYPSLRVHPGLV